MSNRETQRARILHLLIEANGSWVSLTDILDLRIGQYNARLWDLRRSGHTIENRTEKVDGAVHSWYRLVRP
jgi:Helix-turn-helix domain